MIKAFSKFIAALVIPTALILAIVAHDPSNTRSILARIVLWGGTGLGLLRLSRSSSQISLESAVIHGVCLLLLLLLIIATVRSQSRFHSLHEISSAALAPAFVLLCIPAISCMPYERRRRALLIPFWLLVAIAAVAIIEMLVRQSRPYGLFDDINLQAAAMNGGLLLGFARTVIRPASRLEWLGVGVLAGAQASAASRGADIALLIALAALLFLIWPNRPARRLVLAFGGLVLAAHATVAALPFSLRGSGILDLLSSPQQVARGEPSATARAAIWNSTIQAIKRENGYLGNFKNSGFGTGLGTYILVYPRYRSTSDLSSTGERAHSDYLERWLEGGVPLAIATLAFSLALPIWLLSSRRRAIIAARNDSGGWASSVSMACLSLCFGVHAAVNFILPSPALALLFAIAIGCAVPSHPITLGPIRAINIARKSVGLACILIMPLILLPIAVGNWLTSTAGRYWQHHDLSTWMRVANAGIAIQPSNSRFREAVVDTTLQIALLPAAAAKREIILAEAGRDLDAWLTGNQCDTHAWEILARLARVDPMIAGMSPIRALLAARDCQPTSVALRGLVAEELERLGDIAGAYAELEAGLPWAALSHDGPGLERWLAAGSRLAPTPRESAIWQDLNRQLELRRATRAASRAHSDVEIAATTQSYPPIPIGDELDRP